jgi:hypothetical protein
MECGDDGITIEVDGVPHQVVFADITRARTVFDWGPQPKKTKEKSSQ